MKLTRSEQETIINFNAEDKTATVYTRDKAVMRRFEALIIADAEHYRLIDETDISRTYEMPKEYVSYRKPRRLTERQREAARGRMEQINSRR